MHIGPLINITSVKFKSQLTLTPAKYEATSYQPSHSMQTQKGGLDIETSPIKMQMDSTEFRASIGIKTIGRLVDEAAEAGKRAAFDAGSRFASDGTAMLRSNKNIVGDLVKQRLTENITVQTGINFLPAAPEITWTDPSIKLNYEKDRLIFDWDVNRPLNVEYMPCSFNFQVEQYNRVDIEYLPGPNYVPQSAGNIINAKG